MAPLEDLDEEGVARFLGQVFASRPSDDALKRRYCDAAVRNLVDGEVLASLMDAGLEDDGLFGSLLDMSTLGHRRKLQLHLQRRRAAEASEGGGDRGVPGGLGGPHGTAVGAARLEQLLPRAENPAAQRGHSGRMPSRGAPASTVAAQAEPAPVQTNSSVDTSEQASPTPPAAVYSYGAGTASRPAGPAAAPRAARAQARAAQGTRAAQRVTRAPARAPAWGVRAQRTAQRHSLRRNAPGASQPGNGTPRAAAAVDTSQATVPYAVGRQEPQQDPPSQIVTREDSFVLNVADQEGGLVSFRIKPTTRFEKVFEAYANKRNLCPSITTFCFDGARVSGDFTAAQLGMEDGDILDCVLQQRGGKPVILLYPEQETACRVQLSLSLRWDLSCVFPQPQKEALSRSIALWDVTALPGGDLVDAQDKREYPYLFWEAESNGRPFAGQGAGSTAGNMFHFDQRRLQASFCVRGAEAGTWLYGALQQLGLTARERTDMITFWLPQLEASGWNLVHFLDEAEYSKDAALDIQPAPDTLIRCFMIFQGRGEHVPGCQGMGQLPAVPRERRGFTAVEWGGMNLGRAA